MFLHKNQLIIKEKPPPLLLLGIGNAGRGDDGLGWAFLDRLAHLSPDTLTLAYRYQLAPEDAELLTHFTKVVFVDATETPLPEGYALHVCTPDSDAGVYTHQQTPGAVLYLANVLYQHEPQAFLLTLQGYDWELGAGLSTQAAQNLQRALVGFRRYFDLP